MTTCSECGAQLSPDAKFCGSCGQAVDVGASGPARTDFATQVRIVNDFFMEYGHEHEELLAANDLGFPLAVAVVQGGITPDGLSPVGQAWIEQTFAAVLEHLEVSADQAFSNVDQILEQAE